MSPARRKIIIAVATTAIIVLAAYSLLAEEYAGSRDANPYNYVPANATMVAVGSFNSTKVYVFSSNNSSAILLPVTIGDLRLYAQATDNNTTKSISVNQYSTYMSDTIFAVKNLNISRFASGHGGYSAVFSTLAKRDLSTSNGTYYAADTGTVGMALGNITAVRDSIKAAGTGATFANNADRYMSATSNYTFYFKPSGTPSVQYITGNISDGKSQLHVNLTNHTTFGSFEISKGSSLNLTVTSKPGSVTVVVTGKYSASKLLSYETRFLTKAGL